MSQLQPDLQRVKDDHYLNLAFRKDDNEYHTTFENQFRLDAIRP